MNFSLIGIHEDGGLQERLASRRSRSSRSPARAAVAALVEPVSIAVRAVHRGRVAAGEHVVVLGAGPIGQALLLAAQDRGASVLVVDPLETGSSSRARWAPRRCLDDADEVIARRARGATARPQVVIDATGVPAAVARLSSSSASAGRVVQVGMSGDDVTFRLGSFTEKELDFLGVACCGSGEFARGGGPRRAQRRPARAARQPEFALAEAPDALRFAMERPAEVMKVVIRGDRA